MEGSESNGTDEGITGGDRGACGESAGCLEQLQSPEVVDVHNAQDAAICVCHHD